MIKKYIKFLWVLLAMAGCENLEDTYSDYAGDGVIRYVGKCTDVSVKPGWERLIVNWTNNVDPTIANIKISWKLNKEVKDTLLAPNTTECVIPNVKDGNYEVTVGACDKEGRTSLSIPLFCRPYTMEHEDIRSFTRLMSNHFFVKDRLVLFLLDWSKNVESAELCYTSDGNLKSLVLDSTLVTDNKYYLLPDRIDRGTDVVLKRIGRIDGCEDLIEFEPFVLGKNKIYSTDFRLLAKSKYGQEEITDAWVESIVELEYDFSVNSLEDILNLPNLKKVVLGKNRHLRQAEEDYKVDETAWAELVDMERCLFVLDVAHEVFGLEVERYGKHYFSDSNKPAWVIDVAPFPDMPDLDMMDISTWTTTCSWEDTDPYDSHLEYLFDGDISSNWQPELIPSLARTYSIELDMLEKKTIQGIKVVQKSFDDKDVQSRFLMPDIIKVEVSLDKLTWEKATFVDENVLGVSNGETTIINFKAPMNARYMRFTLYDQLYGQNFSVSLAEIGVF